MIRESAVESTELTWFKSTYSDSSNGNDCVEVAATWFKSSYSSSSDGEDCVEIAACPTTIHIRDSKTPEGDRLGVTPRTWAAFVSYAAGR
ncbi:DUF397 domain-containing protein [Streptomyces sp. NBC_00442]|uniref:DUF397 domain-containing protein n=1 Tax=Streptomyces sp. NBC_00442 TaxID=2903651 RepID=UPI002E248C1E